MTSDPDHVHYQELLDLAISLAGSASLEEALPACLNAAIRISGMDCGGIYLVDEITGDLDLACSIGLSKSFREQVGHCSKDSDPWNLTMQAKPIYIRYSLTEAYQDEICRGEGLHAIAILPILHQGQVISCFNIASHVLDDVPSASRKALEAIAAQIGSAMARIQAEDALRESRKEWQSLFDSAGDLLFVMDLEGRVLQANWQAILRLGYTREDLLGIQSAELLPPEWREESVSIIDEMLDGKRELCAIPLLTKDGKEIPVETKVTAGRWSGKDVLFVISRDIAERNRLMEAQKKSEEEYRILVENANEAVIVAQDGMLKFFNPKTVAISGYSAEELASMPFIELIHPDDQQEVMEKHLRRLNGEELPEVYDFRFIDKEGNVKWTELKTVLITWENRPATLNLLSDITERKQGEEAYRALVDQSLQGLMIFHDDSLVFCNQAFISMSGYALNELLGRSLEDIMDYIIAEDRTLVWSRHLDRLQGKTVPDRYEFRALRKDGSLIWLETCVSIIDFRGKPSIQAVVLDITERKEAEEELKRYRAHLEELVAERTDELRREIAERQKAEERLNELNKCFLSFGPNPEENINRLVALCGEQLGATYALYNRLEDGLLRAVGQWNTPSGFVSVHDPEGHISYDLITAKEDKVKLISDLPKTTYARTDPNVQLFGLKTFLGKTVLLGGSCIGSLCAVYQDERIPSEEDKKLLEIAASAVAVEEERHFAESALIESELRFRRLAENAPDVITRFELRPRPHFSYVSPAIARSGYTPDEFYEDPQLGIKLVHPEDRHIFESFMVGETISEKPFAVRWRCKDGNYIWTEHRRVPVYDESSHLVAMESIVRDITERVNAEELIRASLREKELLIKEVHHRVKNNLQVICSLLNLQSDHIKDPKAVEIFRESQNRVKSMAIIHEKLYKSKDLASIDFEDYARALASDLFKSYGSASGRVQLRVNVQDVFLGIDTAIPLGLIINELLSNALKHAFPQGRDGEIQIDLLHKDAGFELVVGDNGIGFPEDLDFRNTESLGLQLVVTLTDQLKGTIELDRTRGTEFRIAFSEID